MKKFISVILILAIILSFFTSCGSDDLNDTDPDAILNGILKSYRTDGMVSWWEILAVYNAGENPMDYKGFDDLYKSLEGTSNLKMASYVIVADIAIIIGADGGNFDKYEEYKSSLKNLLENPSDDYTLNDYIFGYIALKCSGMDFNQGAFFSYLIQAQKPDGGFTLSGDSGDVDMTAFALYALQLLYRNDNPNIDIDRDALPLNNTIKFLENNINENGTFSSYGNENANSTACAITALSGSYGDETMTQKASDGLALFKVTDKKQTGYSYLIDGKADTLATAQAAIALGCLKNKTSVWEKLYLDSINELRSFETFYPEE